MMRSKEVWNRIHLIILSIALVTLLGCASAPEPQEEDITANPENTSNTPTETPLPIRDQSTTPTNKLPDDKSPDIVLVFKRSGGFAGIFKVYTIYSNGRITSNDGGEWVSDTQQIDLLIEELKHLGLSGLAGDYTPVDACCDLFTYEMTFNSGDQLITLRTVDGASDTPKQLWEALGLVQDFLDQHINQ